MPPTLADLRTQLERGLAGALQPRLDAAAAGAAARAVLSGAPLPAEIAARCGAGPVAALVSFDADRIQSWVFASERVQVGKGASFTLDQLNKDVGRMPDEIDGVTGVVYSAGGGGMLFAQIDDLDALVERVRRWLEPRSLELTFTVVALPLYARDLAPSAPPLLLPASGLASLDRFERVDGVRGALVRLQVLVRQAKDARPRFRGMDIKLPVRPGAAADRCPSCNRRPRTPSSFTDDRPQTWCALCQKLRRVCLEIEEGGDDDEKAATFEKLAEAGSAQRRYLGFVAVDGNGMGQVVQGVRDFLQLRAFSEATTAVYKQARNKVGDVLAQGYLRKDFAPAQWSLSLLSGGDEITLVLPSSAAPHAALAVLREVEAGFDRLTAPGELLHEAFQGEPDLLGRLRGAGAAAGWIAARPEYPVRLLRRYAEALQKAAKEVCGPGAARSAAAWRVLSDASPLPEGIAKESRPAELPLAAQERLLREAETARAEKVPTSALWTVLGQVRKEDESLRSVPPGAGRNEVLGLLGANFFRYQMARHARLAAWWREVRADQSTAADVDDVAPWFQAGGAERLERLLDLHSLAPHRGASEKTA